MINLKTKYLSEIKSILKEKVPNCTVWIFGSRVTEKAKKFSDIDLVIIGKEKLNWKIIEDLKQSFSESNIIYTVDVVDWHAITDNFQKIIRNNYEAIQEVPS